MWGARVNGGAAVAGSDSEETVLERPLGNNKAKWLKRASSNRMGVVNDLASDAKL